jgi:hypothetical protein
MWEVRSMFREILGFILIVIGVFAMMASPVAGGVIAVLGAFGILLQRLENRPPPAA